MRRILPMVLALAAAPELAATDLKDCVPSDAFLYSHVVPAEKSAWMEENWNGVLDAIKDARFDQSVVDIMVAVAGSGEEKQKIREIHQYGVDLFTSVPWSALCEHEFVFAEQMRAHGSNAFGQTMLFASRVDDDVVPALHRGLLNIGRALSTLDTSVELKLEVLEGGGRAVHRGDAVVEESFAALERGAGLLYSIEFEGRDAIAFAFDGPHVLFGGNLGCRETVDASLSLLRGDERYDVVPITSTARFARAFDALPEDAGSERFYLDFPNMFGPIQGFVEAQLVRERADLKWFGLVEDAFGLVSCLDTVATVKRYEEAREVSDAVFHYADTPSTKRNPIYLAGRGSGDARELLHYVPADATSFRVHGGFDLVPLYEWAQGMVAEYVPRGDLWVQQIRGFEALFAIDIERDILDYVGAPMVSVSMPAARPTALVPADSVTIQRIEHGEAYRALDERIEAMVEVWMPLVTQLIEEGAEQMPWARFDLQVGEPLAAFPEVKRWEFTFFMGTVPFYRGYVGDDLYVMATSQDALERVLAAADGSAPSILDRGPVADSGALPEWAFSSGSMTSYGAMLDEFAQALDMAGGMVGMLGMAVSGDDEEAAKVMQSAAGILPKISRILEALDFLDYTVTFSRSSDDGMVAHTRMVTEYEKPPKLADAK